MAIFHSHRHGMAVCDGDIIAPAVAVNMARVAAGPMATGEACPHLETLAGPLSPRKAARCPQAVDRTGPSRTCYTTPPGGMACKIYSTFSNSQAWQALQGPVRKTRQAFMLLKHFIV